MIKECIKEGIFEEGILSNIVAEVAQGLGRPMLIEAEAPDPTPAVDTEALMEQKRAASTAQRERLLSAINTEAYGGVDLFEGTAPLSQGGSTSPETQTQGPLSDIEPHDPGVDISSIIGMAGDRWSVHMK